MVVKKIKFVYAANFYITFFSDLNIFQSGLISKNLELKRLASLIKANIEVKKETGSKQLDYYSHVII